MKILFIDYLNYQGHKNFNKIHVDAFQELGYEIHFIGGKGQFDNISQINNITQISGSFYNRKFASPLVSRIVNILFLVRVRWTFRMSDYDIIIFPTYDILSLFFFRTKRKVILINHNNVSQLWSRIKLLMTRCLPKNYIHVVLSHEMKNRLQEINPLRECYYIPHGIISPSINLEKPSFIKDNEKFIFCPVNRNYDLDLINKVLCSKPVQKYLEVTNTRLLIKKISDKLFISENISVIDSYMEKAEYDFLIKNAFAVLLPYDKSFQYRCSGIMFECVAYKTPIIASDIPALRDFENDCSIKFFRDEVTFVDAIKSISTISDNVFKSDKFNPLEYWKVLLSEMSK